ncbi:hypothetical protein C0995_001173 [Termitomyces sp. Mi166|nr:hypothetical protein C0995_001173 [Termitomyces sp. Mi166\
MEHIDNLAEECPDNSIATWYKVACDQWQLIELKCELQHPNTSYPVHCPSQLPVAHPLPAIHASFITPPPPAAAQSLPSEISMEGLEVHYLSPSKQEELLLQLLAAKDTSEDPSPDASSVDLSSELGPAAPSTEQEEDF